jgi:GH15 family glucan-1,4-alpha-glucosidase
MPSPISEHALLSNTRGAALVDRFGCIDWMCLPRFDSPALFASLLGTQRHGLWSLAPADGVRVARQAYRGDSLAVESMMETGDGHVVVCDCMPLRPDGVGVIRTVDGLSRRVPMRMRFQPCFGYGAEPARFTPRDGGWLAQGRDEAVVLATPVPCRIDGDGLTAEFVVEAGDRVSFAMTHARGGLPPDPPPEPYRVLEQCVSWWRDWAARCGYDGPWRAEVVRSLLTLKGLIYHPTGGMVAAATTSLPEIIGGERNWDYRYCWLRDATFTLYALLGNGYRDEARHWRDWLVEAVRLEPFTMHVLYTVDGRHEPAERVLDWLPGYRGSRPVRVGNAASGQFQLDIRGEVMDVLHVAREHGLDSLDDACDLQLAVLEDVERRWRDPDHGIWEMRGAAAHFVHSKALAWVAFDRCIRAAERGVLRGPVEHWRAVREAIRDDVYRHGFDRERGVFVQRYGARDLDASLLLLPLVGFVAPDSPEAIATADAIRRELAVDGLLLRYRNDIHVDGLPGHEGAFLPCSFWLVDNLALSGRVDEARALFERLLGFVNHVGLMSEEWDADNGMLGNLPQALTHVGLVNSAHILSDVLRHGRGRGEAPPEQRATADEAPFPYRTQRPRPDTPDFQIQMESAP